MRSLTRSLIAPDAVGTPVTTPWRTLNDLITLRTQELIIVAGGPGGGKSTVAVNLAQQVDYPVLYFAQDTPASVKSRIAALQTGFKTASVYDSLSNPRTQRSIADNPRMRDLRDTLIIEEGHVTVNYIQLAVEALTEWIGKSPPLVIIDNLIDLVVEGHTYHDNKFYAESLPQLKQMARELDFCVMLLHHVTRTDSSGNRHGQGNRPVRLTDLFYGGERTARHVWGVYIPQDNELRVQILKNQDGPADPDGKLYTSFRWLPSFTRIVGG
jgi:replicative DNA helicase